MRLTATELTIAASLARGLDSIERSLASPDDDLAVPNAHRTGEVVDQQMDGSTIVVRARLDPAVVGRLRRDGVSVVDA